MYFNVGTGSGVGTKLLEILQDEYPDVHRCALLCVSVYVCVLYCVLVHMRSGVHT